jgi:hypothetical protein
MAMAFYVDMPRIPQFYYGTEVLMTRNEGARDDGSYRHDFPGGWAGDKRSTPSPAPAERTAAEAQAFVRKLLNWRKQARAVIHHGKLMHYGAGKRHLCLLPLRRRAKVMVVP